MSKKIMGVTVGTPIRPSKFASELADRVEEMVKANTEQEKTVDITENGTLEIVPDVGYKLTKVTANVNVSGENKLSQIVEGTITEITAADLEGATKIRDYAFYKAPITTIQLPNTITTIDAYAFACSSIERLVFLNSITTMQRNICDSCLELENVVLPENTQIQILPYGIFSFCKKLNNVVVPNNFIKLDESAFQSCIKLSNITLSNNLTEISSYCFYGCEALTTLTIPSTVSQIRMYALRCGSSTNIATFTFLGTTPPTIANNTFDANYLNKIIVPIGCGEAYKTATNWANFADFIEEATE